MADLVTLVQAKAWLEIDPADTSRDALLTSLVTAASDACIAIMAHDPTLTARNVVMDGYGGAALPMNHYPIVSVQSVTINPELAGLPLEPSQYDHDDNLIFRRDGVFPRGRRNIAVSFTAGLDPIPMPIQTAVLYTLKAMADAQLTDMNSAGEQFPGVGGSSFWAAGPGAVPPQAITLLAPYANPLKV